MVGIILTHVPSSHRRSCLVLESLRLLCGCFSLGISPPLPSVAPSPRAQLQCGLLHEAFLIHFFPPAGNGLSPGAVGWAMGKTSELECTGVLGALGSVNTGLELGEGSRSFFFFRFVLGCRHSRKFRINKQQSHPELSLDWSEEAKCQLQFKSNLVKTTSNSQQPPGWVLATNSDNPVITFSSILHIMPPFRNISFHLCYGNPSPSSSRPMYRQPSLRSPSLMSCSPIPSRGDWQRYCYTVGNKGRPCCSFHVTICLIPDIKGCVLSFYIQGVCGMSRKLQRMDNYLTS